MNKLFQRAFVLSTILCCVASLVPRMAHAKGEEGKELFKQICVACHTINGGKLVGPDLANVHKRRSEEWIIRFVKSSQAVIKAGDPYAVELFEEFNKIPMPDNNYSDDQIRGIIDYIAINSPEDGSVTATAQADTPPRTATEADIRAGQMLFGGATRLENGGPTCISCHNVTYDDITSGGALAKDLTDAHSRLSGAGVTAIIASPPFPAMRKAYEGRSLSEDELFSLTAFLQHVDSERASQRGQNYVARMLLSGVGGAILLLGLLSGVWRRTKKRSVNHAIYERQVKSTWEVMGDSERIG